VICGNEIYILIDEEMAGHDLHTGILCILFTWCVWYIKYVTFIGMHYFLW